MKAAGEKIGLFFFHHEQNHNMTKPLHVLGAHNTSYTIENMM